MKLKLTSVMLIAVLAAGTYRAEAARLGSITVGTVNDGTNPVLTPDSSGMNSTSYEPYVLDGTPGQTKFTISQSGDFNNALFVREGELSISGTGKKETVITLTPPDTTNNIITNGTIGAATWLNVSGNGASMIVDNATVQSNRASSMVVGGLDGNGSLELKNGAVLNNLNVSGIGLFIGSVTKGANALTNYYAAHVHQTKNYTSGQYDQLGNNSSKSIGAGTVTIDGGSQLYAGYMTLSVGQGHLKLSDASEIYVGYEEDSLNDGKIDIGKDTAKGTHTANCNQHETVFGDVEGGVAVIDILAGEKENSGSKFYSANALKIAAHDNTSVTVNVDGKGSLLLVDGTGNGYSNKTYVGYKFKTTGTPGAYDRSWTVTGGTKSTSSINITNGGQASLMDTYLGHSSGSATVNVLIDQESSMDTTNLTVEKGTTITNKGELSATGTITLNGGTLILEDGALVEATQLIIKSGATLETAEFSDDTAVVLFSMTPDEEALMEAPSAAVINADLSLEDGALVHLNGVGLDMNGKSLTMGNNIQVTYTGNAGAGEELVLFRNVGNSDTLKDTEFNLIVNGKNTTATVSGDNIVIAAAVPEPTTATLSLLALAALAARRRRK